MDDVTTKRPTPAANKVPAAPAAPELPPPPPTDYRMPLSKRVQAHGEEIGEIVFREPTGQDLVRCGNPLKLDLSMDMAAMETHMSTLGNVPPSTIRQMSAKDWNTAAFELMARFFAPDWARER